jgi:dihydrodipicolinate synthase/N-acetylneuraminate lyase
MKEIGPIVPIVTPCSRNGEIDAQGFRAVCQEMLKAGCAGIFIGGSTGRGPWFNLKDRAAICRMAADCIQENTLLLGGCTALGLPGMIDAARVMADSGAKAVVATAPGYFHYDQEEVEAIFLKFADASPLPVMIYDIPEFTNMQFTNDLVLKLAKHGNIMGLKDSSANLEHFETLLDALRDRSDFTLFQGKEMFITESLRRGASGFIVSVIHLAPQTFVELYQAVRAGKDEHANSIQAGIDRMMELVFGSIRDRPESSTLFHLLNIALEDRGVCKNILLDHDGDAPAWLVEKARLAVEMGKAAINPVRQEPVIKTQSEE